MTAESIAIPIEQDLRLMHERGYARDMPRFLDQCEDESRKQEDFICQGGFYVRPQPFSEHDGLVQLRDSLLAVAAKEADRINLNAPVRRRDTASPGGKAAAFLQNLNFVGATEMDKADEIIAADWKAFMDEDPENQLCILTGQLHVDNDLGVPEHYNDTRVKSDRYMLERVLAQFTPEERAHYLSTGKLCLDPSQLTAKPSHVQIRAIDDRSFTAKQMEGVSKFMHREYPQWVSRTRLQLVIATESQLTGGIFGMPVSAVYRAHHAVEHGEPLEYSTRRIRELTTSLYSTGDYAFKGELPGECFNTPLAWVRPPYRDLQGPLPITAAAIELANRAFLRQQQTAERTGSLAISGQENHSQDIT